jgi:hypothetical protein
MEIPLLPCPACLRHVRTNEQACPFCLCAIPASFARESEHVQPLLVATTFDIARGRSSNMFRTGMAGIAVASAAIIASACSMYGAPPLPSDTPPPGDVPDSCCGLVYLSLPSTDCASCAGHPAYALCVGGTYSVCDCEIPSAYSRFQDAACDDSGNNPDSKTID